MKRALLIFALSARLLCAADDREQLENERKNLAESIAKQRANVSPDLFADVDVFAKGITWALRYDTVNADDLKMINRALGRGHNRLQALEAKQPIWTKKQGPVLRGYVSAVDGSTQPYGVIVPKSYDGTKPTRLDVVLHGSSKAVGMSELRFSARFDDGDTGGKTGPDVDYIELHPLGRVENCYRWAGETDVFEAIDSVCRNYNIDRERIVLRGMSMGASGTWHLGLKHPSSFVALGPYCGYVDTHKFSLTPGMGFPVVGPLPPHQESTLHMLDSVDYCANATMVPAIACIGGKDPFFEAHVIMNEAMAKEGVQMVNLMSPNTKHQIDPVTMAEQMKLIGLYVDKGLQHTSRKLRFVTWTLKYNRCQWLEILALNQHYERAEFIANLAADGSIDVSDAKNITEFAVNMPCTKIRIAKKDVAIPEAKSSSLVFALREGEWKCLGPRETVALSGKRPGLQGPIDDAFVSPFLCVRGTGKAWNPQIAAWTDANLRRFQYEFARYMRGDLQVKNDSEVTEDDIRTNNLILFGDPGSNSLIAKALPKLPISWTADDLTFGTEKYSSKDHAPAFICVSPLAADHYIVINSGHTFHEKEFSTLNYLLFPRLGDWAIMKTASGAESWKPSSDFPEEVIKAGFFDVQWGKPLSSEK